MEKEEGIGAAGWRSKTKNEVDTKGGGRVCGWQMMTGNIAKKKFEPWSKSASYYFGPSWKNLSSIGNNFLSLPSSFLLTLF